MYDKIHHKKKNSIHNNDGDTVSYITVDGPNGVIAIWQENNRNRDTQGKWPQLDTICHLWDLFF